MAATKASQRDLVQTGRMNGMGLLSMILTWSRSAGKTLLADG